MNKLFENKPGFSRMGIPILVIIIAVVVAALAAFLLLRTGGEGTIKIGAVLSLSGPGADIGMEVRDGMLLAIEEVNSRGGINGRKIKLVVEDSETKPEEGKKALSRVEATHHPVLYVSTLSSVSVALAPLAKEHKVVLVGLCAAAPQVTEQKEWVFRYWLISRSEIPPIVSILEERKVKKLGILYLNDEYGTSVFRLLKKEFGKTGGTAIAEAYTSKETEFKDPVNKLMDTEAIYVVGYGSHFGNAFKALRRENFEGLILASDGACHYAVRNLPESQGVYLAAFAIYDPNFLFARKAKEKYEAKYEKPFTHRVANGYDFIKLLSGLLRDKEISRESVKSLLEEGFIYPGVFGSIEVKPGEHDITFPLHPARIVDGEVEFLR